MSTTSTVIGHLAMVHNINGTFEVGSKTSETSEYVQPKLETFISSKTSYPTQSPHHVECTRSTAEHRVQDMRPLSMVSSLTLRKIFKKH